IVSPPATPPQTVTVWLDVCPVSTMVAVLVYEAQVLTITLIVREYVKVCNAKATGGSVAVTVPSWPWTLSVTVIVLWTVLVGAPKVTAAVPLAEPVGVLAAPASHVAVAV